MDSIIKKFKSGNLVVHCITEEQAKEFVKICFENDIKWCGHDSCNDTFWEGNGCYRYGDLNYLVVGTKGMYRDKHYLIITFDEFMEEYNKMKQFTLDDLKTGMLVVDRDGNEYIVFKNCPFNYYGVYVDNMIVNGQDRTWMDLADYHDNLLCNSDIEEGFEDNRNLDIMEVYELPHPYCIQDMEYRKEDRKLLWKREERKVKQLTLEEISELLGYEVEIVGGK
jgi:hypothetical protein